MKTRKTAILITLITVSFAFSCNSHKKDKTVKKTHPKLELVWQTDSILTTCESVLFDKEMSIIYVANINQSPWKVDNNGFISTIDTSGNVLNHKWIEGLSGPKGMGIYNGKLYVTDINRVVEIDITERKIVKTYPAEGNPNLNDITITPNGIVYVSDSKNNKLYSIKDGVFNTVANDDFGGLNGIQYHNNSLYFLGSKQKHLGIYDVNNNTKKILTHGIASADGLVALPNNDFMASNWNGEVFYIKSSDWSKKQLLNTTEIKINSADIGFIADNNLLLVPTFYHNCVMCYRLKFE